MHSTTRKAKPNTKKTRIPSTTCTEVAVPCKMQYLISHDNVGRTSSASATACFAWQHHIRRQYGTRRSNARRRYRMR
eukprot:329723-Rhodomonas_salina.1